jgi:hypothetical protein
MMPFSLAAVLGALACAGQAGLPAVRARPWRAEWTWLERMALRDQTDMRSLLEALPRQEGTR